MPLSLVASNDLPANSLTLDDGHVECMGEGLFIVFQTDENGTAQSLVLTEADLRVMLDYREHRLRLAA